MKILKGLLWVAIIGLSYMVYKSVVGPVEFNKVKEERYIKTITNCANARIPIADKKAYLNPLSYF